MIFCVSSQSGAWQHREIARTQLASEPFLPVLCGSATIEDLKPELRERLSRRWPEAGEAWYCKSWSRLRTCGVVLWAQRLLLDSQSGLVDAVEALTLDALTEGDAPIPSRHFRGTASSVGEATKAMQSAGWELLTTGKSSFTPDLELGGDSLQTRATKLLDLLCAEAVPSYRERYEQLRRRCTEGGLSDVDILRVFCMVRPRLGDES